jgi:hypothetical protein
VLLFGVERAVVKEYILPFRGRYFVGLFRLKKGRKGAAKKVKEEWWQTLEGRKEGRRKVKGRKMKERRRRTEGRMKRRR